MTEIAVSLEVYPQTLAICELWTQDETQRRYFSLLDMSEMALSILANAGAPVYTQQEAPE